jgi:hypothetical protein
MAAAKKKNLVTYFFFSKNFHLTLDTLTSGQVEMQPLDLFIAIDFRFFSLFVCARACLLAFSHTWIALSGFEHLAGSDSCSIRRTKVSLLQPQSENFLFFTQIDDDVNIRKKIVQDNPAKSQVDSVRQERQG